MTRVAFWANEIKRDVKIKQRSAAKPRGYVPIQSLNKLGCSVCPRDTDRDLLTPKMAPAGDAQPLVYLMGSAPSVEEDDRSEFWVGRMGKEITSKFPRSWFDRNVRSGHIVQCMPKIGGPGHPEIHELECCRGRVVADIEASKPLIVAGIGDDVLRWATKIGDSELRSALTHRGTLIATRIGNHDCWYYPLIYPHYLHRESYRKSPYEMAMDHDVAELMELAETVGTPRTYQKPYDEDITKITGTEAGDMQRLEEAFHRLLGLKALALDIETTGIKPHKTDDPRIISAAVGSFDDTVAFMIDHPEGWGTETRMRKVRGMFGEFLLQSGRKRCHHVAFEQEWCSFVYGPDVLRMTEWDCTMAAAHIADERKGVKSLDVQCRIHFGFFLKDQSPVNVKRPNWWLEYTLEQILRYNALDTKWTDLLMEVQLERFRQDPREMKLYEDRVRLAPTLVLTTARGLPVDFAYAERYNADLTTKVRAVEDRLFRTPEVVTYEKRYGRFEPGNSNHVMKLMKDVLDRDEINTVDREGEAAESTDVTVLEAMPSHEVPSAKLILDHRQLTRNQTTYLGPLLEGKMTGADGELHAEYQSLVAETGRLTSELHNWPKHKHKEVRGAVAARGDEWLVAADYGQIEFRAFAMVAEDDKVIEYSWTGYDVHKFWAERLVRMWGRIKDVVVDEFEIDWDEKGIKTLRQVMKNNWVFPKFFGGSTKSCAANMHVPIEIAEDLAEEFWDAFRGVKKWQERLLKGYEKNLYVETLGGWRRRGPLTLNQVINAPIQGTAAEIVLEAMNAISERAEREQNPNIQPAYNGHDDLTYRVADDRLEDSITVIVEEMCKHRFPYINVPLMIEVSVGSRWHELEEIGKYSSEQVYGLRNPFK